MVVKLDSKDMKILRELDANSRQPLSKIAKKTGLNQEVVRYRMGRLVSSGVITKFITLINTTRLGMFGVKVYLNFRSHDAAVEQEMVSFLKNSAHVTWIARFDGQYDIAFTILVEGIKGLQQFLSVFMNRFSKDVLHYDVALVLYGMKFSRLYFGERQKEPGFFSAPAVPHKPLDEIDKSILSSLSEDSRASTIEIANRIKGMRPESIGRRIKGLEETGIINRYTLSIDPETLGMNHIKLLVDTEGLDEKSEREMREFCSSNPNITYLIRVLGPWDLEINFEVKRMADFRKAYSEFKLLFGDVVSRLTPLYIASTEKFTFFPSLPRRAQQRLEK